MLRRAWAPRIAHGDLVSLAGSWPGARPWASHDEPIVPRATAPRPNTASHLVRRRVRSSSLGIGRGGALRVLPSRTPGAGALRAFSMAVAITATSLPRFLLWPRWSVAAPRASLQVPLQTDVGLEGRRGRHRYSPVSSFTVAGLAFSLTDSNAPQPSIADGLRTMSGSCKDAGRTCSAHRGPMRVWTVLAEHVPLAPKCEARKLPPN